MSLRDQLLKQGLASKQQAKKAAKAAKKKQHQTQKAQRKADEPLPKDEVLEKIAKDREEQKNRDIQLNKENLDQSNLLQAVNIVYYQGEPVRESSSIAYYFKKADGSLDRVYVDGRQRKLLSEGELGIMTLLDDRYYLFSKAQCLQVKSIRPDFVVCLY